ncbi:hypothetical protein C1646_810735 [Rhizophagus diaphanus]|nr:hypothetical protein C1646_810735 [Rhizophagus diaphanus] [Rhizophagus sp. MUCL 43196]
MEVTVDDISFALRDEAIKQLYEFEKDMLKVEFKVIRDEQLKVKRLWLKQREQETTSNPDPWNWRVKYFH